MPCLYNPRLIDIEHKLHSNEILMNDRMRTVICTAYVKHRAYGLGGRRKGDGKFGIRK